MRNLLRYVALAGLMAIAVAGCGDDPVNPPGNNGGAQFTFKQNDRYTYNFYTRDENNQRNTSSKQVKVWTVLNANHTIGGRSGVAVIAEETFDANGTTSTGQRDTFYIQSTSDGKVYQYDLLRSVVERIPGASAFVDSVPRAWIQISNTSSAGATNWAATGSGPITSKVTILGFQADITLAMPASHKGTQSVTVPKGTIANSVHTDHQVIITAATQFGSSSDSLAVGYDVSPTEGIVRQTLNSDMVTLLAQSQQVPGFEMELVSSVRAQ